MSSLWTPEGEHRVTPPGASQEPDFAESEPNIEPRSGPGSEPRADRSEESQPDIETLEHELLEAPVEDIIANHCFGLFQLAALHLSTTPPSLVEARLAADALGALVEGLGDRLGASAPSLMEGLTQLRLAFVKIETAPVPSPDGPESNGIPTTG